LASSVGIGFGQGSDGVTSDFKALHFEGEIVRWVAWCMDQAVVLKGRVT